jgi:hypothetical protein
MRLPRHTQEPGTTFLFEWKSFTMLHAKSFFESSRRRDGPALRISNNPQRDRSESGQVPSSRNSMHKKHRPDRRATLAGIGDVQVFSPVSLTLVRSILGIMQAVSLREIAERFGRGRGVPMWLGSEPDGGQREQDARCMHLFRSWRVGRRGARGKRDGLAA